jgi:hypothetical protein
VVKQSALSLGGYSLLLVRNRQLSFKLGLSALNAIALNLHPLLAIPMLRGLFRVGINHHVHLGRAKLLGRRQDCPNPLLYVLAKLPVVVPDVGQLWPKPKAIAIATGPGNWLN